MTRLLEPDPADRLCGEILAEGRRQAKEIQEEAQKEGAAILAQALAEAQRVRDISLEAAHQEAMRRRERILADIPIEIGRIRAARIEVLLESVRQDASRDLAERRGFDYRDALLSLATEALEGMDGEAFTLNLAPEEMGLGEEILRQLTRPGLSLTLTEDPTITQGGLILRDREGRQVWDNRLPERLARLWPRLRVPLARSLGLLGEP